MLTDDRTTAQRAVPAAVGVPGMTRHSCVIFACDVVFVTMGEPQTPFGRVEETLRDLERRFSRFLGDNELADLNAADGAWVSVSAEMERLLGNALRVSVASRGLVNIAATRAVQQAGYVAPWPQPWQPDDTSAVAPLPALTEVLELRPGRARLTAGTCVDFGALAKGMWADDAVRMLGNNAAAGLGGDVSARGPGPAESGWPIGLPNGRTVTVRDGGVATSGTSKRRSGAAHHVIDPRTGGPTRSGLAEVSVIARSATAAEWIATALLIGGSAAIGHLPQGDIVQWFAVQEEGQETDER